MLNERKLTERELDKRAEAIQGLLSNKRTLVKKYGKDAEKVMYGIATKQAKSKVEDMNKDKLKELIQQSLEDKEKKPLPKPVDKDLKKMKTNFNDLKKRLKLEDTVSETLNPEVSQAVSRFIKAMAQRYDYTNQDAVYAIMAALRQRSYDGLNERVAKIDEILDEGVVKDMHSFLNDLRDSGVTNMFGAAPYLQKEFGLDKREARQVLANWMQSFSESLDEGVFDQYDALPPGRGNLDFNDILYLSLIHI